MKITPWTLIMKSMIFTKREKYEAQKCLVFQTKLDSLLITQAMESMNQ